MALVTHAFRVPLNLRFRGVTARQGLLLRGPSGWGEFSPFAEYGPDRTRAWRAAALEAAQGTWPPPLRDRVPVNVTVPAVAADVARRIVEESGCATAKVKVAEPGESARDEEARIEAVREALGPMGKLRIDANAGWDLDTAARRLAVLGRWDLEYAEQPVAALEDMARLRRRVDVPLAADESVRHADDPLRIAGIGAADIVVLKVQPLGGVHRALEVAERAGLPAVVSSAVETSVGLAAGIALAAALPELAHACGLGTALLLGADVVADPLLPREGWVEVRRPEPSPELLASCALDPSAAAAFQRRWEEAA